MSNTIHVYPLDDLIEHDTEGPDCICGPEVEPVPRPDGSMGFLLSHHSLDNREDHDPRREAPPKPENPGIVHNGKESE